MDENEIKRYCVAGHGVCVYRKRVKKAQFIIQCINIYGGKNARYDVCVEFDPMGMVDQGEGIRWGSSENNIEKVVSSLEKFIGKPISNWENHTKSGFEPKYESEIVTSEHYQKSWETLASKYEQGKRLLPKGLDFELLSIL